MAVTLGNIAERIGVSKTTVSRVLNNKMVMPISASTIERVRQAAKEMNYRPNALARALATQKTHTIALVSNEMTDPHFAQLLESVQRKAYDIGYHLVVCNNLKDIIDEGRVDGFLLLASPSTACHYSALEGQAKVFISPTAQALPNCIGWSDIEGTYKAGRYLVDIGHRHIAAIFGNYSIKNHLPDKIVGFRKAMSEGNVEYHEYSKELSSDQFDNGYLLMRDILKEHKAITAIFARNDFLAMGAMKMLREAGISVPQEISIIGYSDTILARCTTLPLTSVHTPIAKAGEIAVTQLIESIQGKVTEVPGIILPTVITLRDSCGAPPAIL